MAGIVSDRAFLERDEELAYIHETRLDGRVIVVSYTDQHTGESA
jgi:hypothetical protein